MVMSMLTAFRIRDQNKPWIPDEDEEADDTTKTSAAQDSPRKFEQLATPRRSTDPRKPRKFTEVGSMDSPRKFRKVGLELVTPRKFEEFVSVPESPRKFNDLATPRRTSVSDHCKPGWFAELSSPRRKDDARDIEELGSPRREPGSPRRSKVVPTPRNPSSPRKTPRDPWRPDLAKSIGDISTPRIANHSLFDDIILDENPNCKLINKFKVTTGRDRREAWIGGITVLDNSHIAVSDMANKTVKIFDMYGNLRKEFWGKGTFKFGEIRGIAKTPENNILLADTERELFYEFSPTGEPIRMKETNGCWRIAMTSAGVTLAIDHKKRCVFMYNTNGTLMRIIATANEAGRCVFISPQSIALGKDDSIIVADDVLNAVQIFDKVGEHQKTYGQKGRGQGLLNGPKSVCSDEEGNIYVADTANDMIQVLTPGGEFKETLLSRADRIHFPWAIAYHDKKLIIAEQFGKVKIFSIKT